MSGIDIKNIAFWVKIVQHATTVLDCQNRQSLDTAFRSTPTRAPISARQTATYHNTYAIRFSSIRLFVFLRLRKPRLAYSCGIHRFQINRFSTKSV